MLASLHRPSVTDEDFPSRTQDVILRATELMFACCWVFQRTDSEDRLWVSLVDSQSFHCRWQWSRSWGASALVPNTLYQWSRHQEG